MWEKKCWRSYFARYAKIGLPVLDSKLHRASYIHSMEGVNANSNRAYGGSNPMGFSTSSPSATTVGGVQGNSPVSIPFYNPFLPFQFASLESQETSARFLLPVFLGFTLTSPLIGVGSIAGLVGRRRPTTPRFRLAA